jgi:lipopolysaccharide export system protein LptC
MLVLMLGVAAVALFVIDRRNPPPVPALPEDVGTREPDFRMEGADVSQYRTDGTLQYRLQAGQVQHFQQAAITRLTGPHLTLFDPLHPPWRASARRGTLRRPPAGAPEEVVDLEEAVTLEQNGPDGNFLRLTTSAMRVYPRRQYAESEQDVMIDSLVGRTTAAGLEGELQIGILNLFSRGDEPVRTVLEPAHFK